MIPTRSEQHVGDVVRHLRELRGLSVRTLATKAGFSASFISQIENGQASPSISSLERIAAELGVSLVEFFQTRDNRPSLVVRASERPRLESAWSKAELESLGGGSGRLEPVLITLAPGGSSGKKAYPRSGEEFAFVIEGEVTLQLGNDQHVLRRGDAVNIPAQVPFRWANEANRAARLLVVSARVP